MKYSLSSKYDCLTTRRHITPSIVVQIEPAVRRSMVKYQWHSESQTEVARYVWPALNWVISNATPSSISMVRYLNILSNHVPVAKNRAELIESLSTSFILFSITVRIIGNTESNTMSTLRVASVFIRTPLILGQAHILWE